MGLDNSSENILIYQENFDGITVQSEENSKTNQNKFSLKKLFSLVSNSELNGLKLDINKITVLELNKCNLNELPKCFKNLNLKHLNLSQNNFTTVPLCLYGGLKKLEHLDLSCNSITQFDMEPKCLLYLRKLNLSSNKFTNVPKWFLTFRCTNLEEFNYSLNLATHYNYLKNSFNLNLMKLWKLELRNCCLLDIDHALLNSFKNLQYLDVSNENCASRKCINKFKDLDALFVKPRWTEMKVLRLDDLHLSMFPEGITWVKSLRELYITNNSLSWFPDGIEFLANLEILDISNNNIIAIPLKLVRLQKLKVFKAPTNYIEGVPYELPKSLEILDLYDNFVEYIHCNLSRFKYVDLEYNYIDMENFCTGCSNYIESRDRFRKDFNENRCTGVKVKTEIEDSDSRESDSDDDSYFGGVTHENGPEVKNYFNHDENWDDEIESKITINPDIGLSDNEWDCEDDCKVYSKDFHEKNRVYLSEEDWMFVDAD